TLASRPALVQALIAVGVVGAARTEDADLVPAGSDDPPVSVIELGRLGDEPFGHAARSRLRLLRRRLLQKRPHAATALCFSANPPYAPLARAMTPQSLQRYAAERLARANWRSRAGISLAGLGLPIRNPCTWVHPSAFTARS